MLVVARLLLHAFISAKALDVLGKKPDFVHVTRIDQFIQAKKAGGVVRILHRIISGELLAEKSIIINIEALVLPGVGDIGVQPDRRFAIAHDNSSRLPISLDGSALAA